MYYLNFTWIRIHMDIFGIPDPDPHRNLCGSETLVITSASLFDDKVL